MIEGYSHRWECPGRTDDFDQATICTTPRQAFTGLQVGLPSLEVICADCRRVLQEGASVHVYAYRPADQLQWGIGRCSCPDCAPPRIQAPTLGTAELLLDAVLAVVSRPTLQTHRLCLAEPTVVCFSSPTEGAPP